MFCDSVIHQSCWESTLSAILSEKDPTRTKSLQQLALRKNAYDDSAVASLVTTLLIDGGLSRESYFYSLYLLRSNSSRIAFLFTLYAELTSKYDFVNSRGVTEYMLTINGISYFQDTTHVNFLIEMLESSDLLKEQFQNYSGYLQEAYLRGDFDFSIHEKLLYSCIEFSKDVADSVLHCICVCSDAKLIINATKLYLKLYKVYFLGALREVVITLGTLRNQSGESHKLLDKLRKYPELVKHIEKSLIKIDKLNIGTVKAYKNPLLRYRSQFITSFGITENTKHLGFYRWCDEKESLYGSNSNHFSDEEIRECTNQVREEIGLKRIGEGWSSETLLYKITASIMQEYGIDVIHHHRPKWLSPQEIDIFFEIGSRQFGIEYQGIQHYKPVKLFGGEQGFKNTVARDKKKKKLCERNNLNLLYFKYTEPVTEGRVRLFLNDILKLI